MARCSGVIWNQPDKTGSGATDLSEGCDKKNYGAIPCQHVGGIKEGGLFYLQVLNSVQEHALSEVSLPYQMRHDNHQLLLTFLFLSFPS